MQVRRGEAASGSERWERESLKNQFALTDEAAREGDKLSIAGGAVVAAEQGEEGRQSVSEAHTLTCTDSSSNTQPISSAHPLLPLSFSPLSSSSAVRPQSLQPPTALAFSVIACLLSIGPVSVYVLVSKDRRCSRDAEDQGISVSDTDSPKTSLLQLLNRCLL